MASLRRRLRETWRNKMGLPWRQYCSIIEGTCPLHQVVCCVQKQALFLGQLHVCLALSTPLFGPLRGPSVLSYPRQQSQKTIFLLSTSYNASADIALVNYAPILATVMAVRTWPRRAMAKRYRVLIRQASLALPFQRMTYQQSLLEMARRR